MLFLATEDKTLCLKNCRQRWTTTEENIFKHKEVKTVYCGSHPPNRKSLTTGLVSHFHSYSPAVPSMVPHLLLGHFLLEQQIKITCLSCSLKLRVWWHANIPPSRCQDKTRPVTPPYPSFSLPP